MTMEYSELPLCSVCKWPLASSEDRGCVIGKCSSPPHKRILVHTLLEDNAILLRERNSAIDDLRKANLEITGLKELLTEAMKYMPAAKAASWHVGSIVTGKRKVKIKKGV